MASSAAAQAAPGTVLVADAGEFKYLRYTGTADANVVKLGGSAATHTLTITEAGIADPGASLDPANVCALSGDTLTCTDPELDIEKFGSGAVDLEAGNDVATISGNQQWWVYGGDGEDTLTGSDEKNDSLAGEKGNDTLYGRGDQGGVFTQDQLSGGPGNDALFGGPGDDQLDGGPEDDDLDGGDGDDYLYGDEGYDVLTGGNGNDGLATGLGDNEFSEGGDGSDWFGCDGNAGEVYDGGAGFDSIDCYGVVLFPTVESHDFFVDLNAGIVRRTNHGETTATAISVEDAWTSSGNDVLIGTDGPNVLDADDGSDRIDGRDGSDQIKAGDGMDVLEVADSKFDRADAGSGADTCSADQVDSLFDCETLTLAPVTPGVDTPVVQPGGPVTADAVDRMPPSVKITNARGNAKRGRITFNVTSDEQAALSADAVGRISRLSRGALASRAGDVTLGTTTARAAARKTVRMAVRMPRRYRNALSKRSRVRVVLRATDAAGNTRTALKTVRF